MSDHDMQHAVYYTKPDGEDCFQVAYWGNGADWRAKEVCEVNQSQHPRFKFRVVIEPRRFGKEAN